MGGVGAIVHGDGVGLAVLEVKLAREDEDETVTEEGDEVAKDEVDEARDATRLVELAERVGVEGVLVAKVLHHLVLVRLKDVGEGQVLGNV